MSSQAALAIDIIDSVTWTQSSCWSIFRN